MPLLWPPTVHRNAWSAGAPALSWKGHQGTGSLQSRLRRADEGTIALQVERLGPRLSRGRDFVQSVRRSCLFFCGEFLLGALLSARLAVLFQE